VVEPATIASVWPSNAAPVPLESELKMNFETSTDVVCITSDEGDALVPGTEARAVAEQEANTTGKPVTIRNPVTDEVLATVRPASAMLTERRSLLCAPAW
jgi:hypothetical protein